MDEKKDFHEKYKSIAKSDWFERTYSGKSLGIEETEQSMQPMKENRSKLEILSESTMISAEELEFKNEIEIVRPSEALEAMEDYAKQQVESLQAELDIEKQEVRNLEFSLSCEFTKHKITWTP